MCSGHPTCLRTSSSTSRLPDARERIRHALATVSAEVAKIGQRQVGAAASKQAVKQARPDAATAQSKGC